MKTTIDRVDRNENESVPINNDASDLINERELPYKTKTLRTRILLCMTAIFIALCLLLAFPFLPAITWGIALAIISWPMHRLIRSKIHYSALSALLSTAAVLMIIIIPGFFVTYHLAKQTAEFSNTLQGNGATESFRGKIESIPVVDSVFAWLERNNLKAELEIPKLIEYSSQNVFGFAQNSVSAAIQFLVAILIMYYIFQDRGKFLSNLRDLLPLNKEESEKVFNRIAQSVHANLYATVITSIIDAIGGGLLFWAFGLPAPLLWGVIIFILSILPVLGAAMIWFPAVLYLAAISHWTGSISILGWGILSFIVVDNIIYIRLAGESMRMHEVPALIAFLGGIAVFGLSGMILGPAILAITIAFLEVWHGRRILAHTKPASDKIEVGGKTKANEIPPIT